MSRMPLENRETEKKIKKKKIEKQIKSVTGALFWSFRHFGGREVMQVYTSTP